ncbi:MAG: hypothetical protein ACYCSF_00960 [Acidimicrobiales bacterium]
MSVGVTFPSDACFEAMAADARNRPDVYQHLGFADFRLVVQVRDEEATRHYGLVLDGYDATYAGELNDLDTFRPDAVVVGTPSTWQDMIDNIVGNGGADGAHTLNALSIAEDPLFVQSDDPLGRDKFYRYAETIQTLFDSLGRPQPVDA